jgi:hypothetical protein
VAARVRRVPFVLAEYKERQERVYKALEHGRRAALATREEK